MDKRELVAAASNRTGQTQAVASDVLAAAVEAIVAAVAHGETVRLAGFGTFEPIRRAPRTARNPRTGEPVPVPERVLPIFRPSPRFKDVVASEASVGA